MNKQDKIVSNQLTDEYNKCVNSPYYFATKYLKLTYAGKSIPFTTHLTEKEFNEQFNRNR